MESLVSFGTPKKVERLVKMTIEGTQAKVIVDGKISTPFGKSAGARQGNVLSATLFQPRSSQNPENPGTMEHDSEETNINMWIYQ